jgi:hypothetical protein
MSSKMKAEGRGKNGIYGIESRNTEKNFKVLLWKRCWRTDELQGLHSDGIHVFYR